jgi:hypothetical protein
VDIVGAGRRKRPDKLGVYRSQMGTGGPLMRSYHAPRVLERLRSYLIIMEMRLEAQRLWMVEYECRIAAVLSRRVVGDAKSRA